MSRALLLLTVVFVLGTALDGPAVAGDETPVLVEALPGFTFDPSDGVSGPLTAEMFASVAGASGERMSELDQALADGTFGGTVRLFESDTGLVAILISFEFGDARDTDDFVRGMTERIDGDHRVRRVDANLDGVLVTEQTMDGQLMRSGVYLASDRIAIMVAVAGDAPAAREGFDPVLSAQMSRTPVAPDDSARVLVEAPGGGGDGRDGGGLAYAVGVTLAPLTILLAVILLIRVRRLSP